MRKQFLYILLVFSLFSCNRNISIEKKWVTTDNNYLLLTQPDDSLSYHWEGGVFENVINGKGTLSAYYAGRQISSKTIKAYYGATSKENVLNSNGSKYIGSVKENNFIGFGVWVLPKEIYIGEFLEGHTNGYLSYYKNGKLSYRGEWQNGMRSGKGTNYKENGKIVSGIWKDDKIFEADTTITTANGIYKGLLRNNLYQGYGELNYFSGSQYRGNWDKGKWHGEGSFTSATDTIIGEWAEGKLNGYGLCKTPYVLLEGDFKEGNLNGEGYMLLPDSTFYSGGWTNGKKNGNGDIMMSNGDTYMGGWKNDQYNGEGRYNYHTGEVYDGHWKNGLQDSLGKYTCKDYTYIGNWEEGWMNGHGKITYPNGDYYEGDFVENQKYGIGYYHFKDGNAYDGEFVNGIFNGLGIFTFKDGSIYQGEFRDGKIKGEGTLFLKEGKETIAITANWGGSTKFPKKASVLFENGDLYEGELDNNGFPTQNGVWTSAQDREKGITAYDKANEFYKRHKDTWKSIVSYTSIALEVTATAALGAVAVAGVVATAPVSVPAMITVAVVSGGSLVVVNSVDMGATYLHSEKEIENAKGDKEKIAQIKKQRNEELMESGIRAAEGAAIIATAGMAGAASSAAKAGVKEGAKQGVKFLSKQGAKVAAENIAKNIDPQDVVDVAEAIIKKDKDALLLNAGIIAAGAVVDIKKPKTNPIRRGVVKLSTFAKQAGKTVIHFTKNKAFGKVVQVVKNSSGVIEKQWVKTTIKGVKESSERLTKFAHHSFKSSIEKTDGISKKLNDLSSSKNIVHAPKGSKNIGWNEGLNETLKPNTLHHIGDHQYYKTDKLGRVDNVTAKLESKITGRNVDQQVRLVYQKDGNWSGKIPDGRAAPKDDGGHLIANVLGGAGEQINYVPMLRNLNRGAYKKMENTLVKAAKKGKEVCMDIKLIYKGSSKRPDKLIVHYTIDGVAYKRIFSNRFSKPIKNIAEKNSLLTQKNVVNKSVKTKDYLSGFDKKFIDYIKQFSNTKTNPDNIQKVYRVMRADQLLDKPIKAKNTTGLTKTGSHFTIEGHIGKGSTTETPYISTFTDKNKALERAKKDGNLVVVEIDLSKVQGNFIDLSNKNVREALIASPRNRNYAQSSSELLIITDEIPIESFKKIN